MYGESGSIPSIYGIASGLVFTLFIFFLSKQNNKDWYFFTEFKFNFLTSFHLIYTLINEKNFVHCPIWEKRK